MLPPVDENGRSSIVRTRIPSETFARIGLSELSNISSVMLNSVKRTGTMRALLQTKSVRGASIGMISSVPFCALASAVVSCWLVG